MKVSVLLLTFNEACNLPRCLDALQWCDDIVVIDSGSTDDTVEIARQRGARVLHRAFDDFASQRNFGLSEGRPKHEWILHLDADEVVTEAFAIELSKLQPMAGLDAYNVPSKLMLHDRWLRNAGMYPVYQVRLGHRERLRFKQVGHGQREDLPPDRIGIFCEPYLHYNFSHGLSAWFIKHVRYARDEANTAVLLRGGTEASRPFDVFRNSTERRRAVKAVAGRLPWALRPFLRFFYIMVIRGGFRDGRAGLTYATMLSVYEGMIAVFGYDRILRGQSTAIPARTEISE